MKFCKTCNNQLLNNSVFCPNCGTKIEETEEQRLVEPNEPIYQAPQQPTVIYQKANGFCIAGFVLSFFVALLGLIFSIIGVAQAKAKNESCRGLGIAGIVISGASMLFVFVALFLATMR